MRLMSLYIPGTFDDAYVYMGKLLAFTAERTLQVWNLDKQIETVQAQQPNLGEIPKWMFCRNDWLALESFASPLKDPENLRNTLHKFDTVSDRIVLDSASYDDEMSLELKSAHLLDVLVYNSRLYLGTDSGLFHLDIEFDYGGELARATPTKRLDSRCVSTSAGYGSVLASCGDDGMFAAADEFGFLDDLESSGEFQQTKERSIRTAWLGHDVVNYRNSADLDLFQARYERVTRNARRGAEERESRVLVGIDESVVQLDPLFHGLKTQFQLDRSDVQFVYNSSGMFFLNTFSGRLFGARIEYQHPGTLDLDYDDDSAIRQEQRYAAKPVLKYLKEYIGTKSSVIGASSTRAGMVFERDADVVLWSNNNWHTLASAPALSVRTFMRSKRYKQLVAITLEGGIQLTGLFDENAYGTGS